MSNNFQSGFGDGITVRGIPLSQAYPGEVFWVNNSSVLGRGAVGGTDNAPGTFIRPFATIDYAIGRTLPNRGDVIVVMPGHAENVTAADGIDVDVAGIAIVGLGSGTLRPQLSLTAAAGAVKIDAANTALIGFDIIATFADVTNGLNVEASGLGTSIENCNFTESAADLNYLSAVTLVTLAHDVSFIDCTFELNDVLGVSCITGVAHDRLWLEDCRFYQTVAQTSTVALVVGSDVTSGLIKNCSFIHPKDDAKFIGFSGTCTGIMRDCCFSSLDVASAISGGFVNSGFMAMNCYVSGEADKWGIIGGGASIAD